MALRKSLILRRPRSGRIEGRTAFIQRKDGGKPPLVQFEDVLPPGLTTIFPTIRGCSEQTYSYSPGVVKVWEKVSSVSSAADLNFRSFSTTVCTSSSALVQVTVVPAVTVRVAGAKAKLLIRTVAGLAATLTAASPA